MLRKVCTLVLTLALFLSLTVACFADEVVLNVWTGLAMDRGFPEFVEAFEAENPGIKVNHTRFVNDDTGNTKLETALLAGEPIDVYFSYGIPRLAKRAEAGLAEELTPLLEKFGISLEEMVGTDTFYGPDGKVYGIPAVSEPTVIMANERAFLDAGIPIPTKWTVDEFRDIAKKLTKQIGNRTRYGVYGILEIARMRLGPNYWYNDEGMSNFDHPAFREQWELAGLMMHEDKSIFPHTEVLARNLRVYPQDVLVNEEAAMMIGGTWLITLFSNLEQYPRDWRIAFLPLPVPEEGKVFYNPGSKGQHLCISPRSENKEAAWKFVEYWLAHFSDYRGRIPTWATANREKAIELMLRGNEGYDPHKLYDVESFHRVVFSPDMMMSYDTITTAAAQIQQIVQEETDTFLIGEQGLDQMLSSMKRRADSAIRRAR
ncbi:MAG: extracellular solute-binding protein [Firmicutes bacterium]|nr:extracellular solute-binding protein [Bacillota bacterium]